MGTGFRTTRWTLIDLLQSGEHADSQTLDALSRQYWPAVRDALLGMGFSDAEAADHAQAFFQTVVLERRLFEQADPAKGRLRSLIRGALRNFVTDIRRCNGREARYAPSAPNAAPPQSLPPALADDTFDQAWAVAVLNEAIQRCRDSFIGRGRAAHWHAFDRCTLQPAATGNVCPPLRDVAEELGFGSAAQVAATNQSVRRRLQVLLREVVSETVMHDDEGEQEYRELLAIFAGG